MNKIFKKSIALATALVFLFSQGAFAWQGGTDAASALRASAFAERIGGFSLAKYEKPRPEVVNFEHLMATKARLIKIKEAAKKRRDGIIARIKENPKRKEEILAEEIANTEEISPHVRALVANPQSACWGVNFGPAEYYEIYSFFWFLALEMGLGSKEARGIIRRWDILQMICDRALWNASGINMESEEEKSLQGMYRFTDELYDGKRRKPDKEMGEIYWGKEERLKDFNHQILSNPSMKEAAACLLRTSLLIQMDFAEFGPRIQSVEEHEEHFTGVGDEHELGLKFPHPCLYCIINETRVPLFTELIETLRRWERFLMVIADAYYIITQAKEFTTDGVVEIYNRALADKDPFESRYIDMRPLSQETRRQRIISELDILARDPRFSIRARAVAFKLGLELPSVRQPSGTAINSSGILPHRDPGAVNDAILKALDRVNAVALAALSAI